LLLLALGAWLIFRVIRG